MGLVAAGLLQGHLHQGALDLLHDNAVDLILLDIMLPNMDGTEVLRRLKAVEKTAHIPVIMLTAKGEEVDRVVGAWTPSRHVIFFPSE